MRWLPLVLVLGCATMKVAAPVTGPVISTRDAHGLEIEVRVTSMASAPQLGPPMFPGTVATDERELPEAFKTTEPIDFTRFVALLVDGGAAPQVQTLEPGALRITAEQTEVRYPRRPLACGGAAITHERNVTWLANQPRLVLLVPRPARKLVIGFDDERCNPALP